MILPICVHACVCMHVSHTHMCSCAFCVVLFIKVSNTSTDGTKYISLCCVTQRFCYYYVGYFLYLWATYALGIFCTSIYILLFVQI